EEKAERNGGRKHVGMAPSPARMGTVGKDGNQWVGDRVENQRDHQGGAGEKAGQSDDGGVVEEQKRREGVVLDPFGALADAVEPDGPTWQRGGISRRSFCGNVHRPVLV